MDSKYGKEFDDAFRKSVEDNIFHWKQPAKYRREPGDVDWKGAVPGTVPALGAAFEKMLTDRGVKLTPFVAFYHDDGSILAPDWPNGGAMLMKRSKRDTDPLPARFWGDPNSDVHEFFDDFGCELAPSGVSMRMASANGKKAPVFIVKFKNAGPRYGRKVETARQFVNAVESVSAQMGRSLDRVPAVCRDAGDSPSFFSMNPGGKDGANSTVLLLQETFSRQSDDDPEFRMFGELVKWMKNRPPDSKLFLKASKNRVYGIRDVVCTVDGEVQVIADEWTSLFEAGEEDGAEEAAVKKPFENLEL